MSRVIKTTWNPGDHPENVQLSPARMLGGRRQLPKHHGVAMMEYYRASDWSIAYKCVACKMTCSVVWPD